MEEALINGKGGEDPPDMARELRKLTRRLDEFEAYHERMGREMDGVKQACLSQTQAVHDAVKQLRRPDPAARCEQKLQSTAESASQQSQHHPQPPHQAHYHPFPYPYNDPIMQQQCLERARHQPFDYGRAAWLHYQRESMAAAAAAARASEAARLPAGWPRYPQPAGAAPLSAPKMVTPRRGWERAHEPTYPATAPTREVWDWNGRRVVVEVGPEARRAGHAPDERGLPMGQGSTAEPRSAPTHLKYQSSAAQTAHEETEGTSRGEEEKSKHSDDSYWKEVAREAAESCHKLIEEVQQLSEQVKQLQSLSQAAAPQPAELGVAPQAQEVPKPSKPEPLSKAKAPVVPDPPFLLAATNALAMESSPQVESGEQTAEAELDGQGVEMMFEVGRGRVKQAAEVNVPASVKEPEELPGVHEVQGTLERANATDAIDATEGDGAGGVSVAGSSKDKDGVSEEVAGVTKKLVEEAILRGGAAIVARESSPV